MPRYTEAAVILTKFLSEENRVNLPLSSILPAPSKPVEAMTTLERDVYIQQLRERQHALIRGENVIDKSDDREQ